MRAKQYARGIGRFVMEHPVEIVAAAAVAGLAAYTFAASRKGGGEEDGPLENYRTEQELIDACARGEARDYGFIN